MNINELKKMDLEAVKQVANDFGVKFHHKHGKDKIITAIVDAMDGKTDAADVAGAPEGDELDELLEAPAPAEQEEPRLSARQKKENEIFEKKYPEQAAKVAQQRKDAGINKVTAVQAFKPDNRVSNDWPNVQQVHDALKSHVQRGLEIVHLDDSYWHFRIKNREASGNLKMPLSQMVFQANLLLQPHRTASDTGSSV